MATDSCNLGVVYILHRALRRAFAKILLGTIVAVAFLLALSVSAQALTSADQARPVPQLALHTLPPQPHTLVVGSEQEYPPFSTGLTDDTAGGFTVDLWRAVATEVGFNYTLRVRPFHQLLQEFREGKLTS